MKLQELKTIKQPSEFDRLINPHRNDKECERSCCIIATVVFGSFAIGITIFLAIMFFS